MKQFAKADLATLQRAFELTPEQIDSLRKGLICALERAMKDSKS